MPGAGTECRAGALREQFLVSLLCSSFPTLERRLRYNMHYNNERIIAIFIGVIISPALRKLSYTKDGVR